MFVCGELKKFEKLLISLNLVNTMINVSYKREIIHLRILSMIVFLFNEQST
jgi:hypothetical protein